MTPEEQMDYFGVNSLPLSKSNSRSRNLIDRENNYLSSETVGYMGGTFESDNGFERELRNQQEKYLQIERARNPQLYYERY
jgi:hypothetical protein